MDNNKNTDKLSSLQENLARDLVHMEDNENLSEDELDQITESFSKVYETISQIKSL